MEILLVDKSPEIYRDFRYHSHGYWEIICNIFGSGTAIIDGLEYPFTEGTIFCIPPGIMHRKVAEQGFMDSCLFIRDFTPVDSRPVAEFSDDSNRTFQKLLLLAFDIQNKDEPNAKAIINSLGDALYQLLVSWSAGQRKQNDPTDAFRDVLSKNIANCHFDIAEEIDKTGYSSSYFRKMFKESSGTSPLNYLNHLRIEYAKRQLQQYHGIRSIKEIALGSGFNDPYYFSRAFRIHEGISPQQYVRGLGSYDRTRMFDGQGPLRQDLNEVRIGAGNGTGLF